MTEWVLMVVRIRRRTSIHSFILLLFVHSFIHSPFCSCLHRKADWAKPHNHLATTQVNKWALTTFATHLYLAPLPLVGWQQVENLLLLVL